MLGPKFLKNNPNLLLIKAQPLYSKYSGLLLEAFFFVLSFVYIRDSWSTFDRREFQISL
jgi:hypothetical protein